MTIQLPAIVNTTPADDMLFLGFGRQDLKFHQALGELIDNAISSSLHPKRFNVEIHIEKKGEDIDVECGHHIRAQIEVSTLRYCQQKR